MSEATHIELESAEVSVTAAIFVGKVLGALLAFGVFLFLERAFGWQHGLVIWMSLCWSDYAVGRWVANKRETWAR